MEPDGLQEGKKVKIFRAQPAFTKVIRTNDYITMSRKFAGDHAVTSAVYNDEPFHVVYAFVDENDINLRINDIEENIIGSCPWVIGHYLLNKAIENNKKRVCSILHVSKRSK